MSQQQQQQQSRQSQLSKSRRYIQSRNNIYSRRVIEVQKLVPLKRQEEVAGEEDEKIRLLRSKKDKIEEALRIFCAVEQRSEIERSERKQKDSLNTMFTTDYKGKVITFCPKASRSKEQPVFPIRVQTVVDSPKPWGRVNLTARKGPK